MKRLYLYFIILAINIILLIARCVQSPVTSTGGSEVWGKVVDTNGVVVSDAEITLCQKNDKDSLLDLVNAFSDSKGEYLFKKVNSGKYLIKGVRSNKELVLFRADIIYDSGKVNIGTDTMKAPGSVICIFKGAKPDQLTGAVGFIPATPYFNFVNNDTLRISGIYPGKYSLKCALTPYGYLPVVIDTLSVYSHQATIIHINVELDTTDAPPAPENLALVSYDTLNGIAKIKWDAVNVKDLDGYQVYSGLDSTFTSKDSVRHKSTTCSLAVATDSTGNSVITYVQVKSVDKVNNESGFSNILKIDAPSPKIVKTRISDTLIKPNELLYRGDTITVITEFANETRAIDSVVWALVRADSVIRTKSYTNNKSGCDSLRIIWGEYNELLVYISVYDNSGNVFSSLKKITGSEMYPPDTWKTLPAQLPTPRQFLTAVSIGNTIFTIGGKGKYYDLTTEVIRSKVFDVIETFKPDSLTAFSTGKKMVTERNLHASVVYNNKIYSIGGTSNKENLSTIEVFDPISGESREIATLQEKIIGASVCAVGSKLVIIGGQRIVSGINTISSSINVFDLSLPANTAYYSHAEKLKFPRTNHCAVVCKDKVYVLGGIDNTSSATLKSVEILDINNGTVTNGPDMHFPRCKFSAVSVNDKIIVFGGLAGENRAIANVEILVCNNGGWESVSGMSSARYGTAAVVNNNKVFIIGGATAGSDGNITIESGIEVYYP